MKPTSVLITACLAAHTQAVGTSGLIGSVRGAAVASFHATKAAVEPAKIPEHFAKTGQQAKEIAGHAIEWTSKNPGAAAVYGLAGLGVVAVAAPAVIATPALGAAGFGAQGVVGGSLAAGVQSGMGNVAASSLFATLQSAGAAGAGAAAVNAVVQVGGAGVAMASGGWAWIRSKSQYKLKSKL
ncbi:hypothetical protein SCUP515_04667 [Seiridium cupressi]